MLLPLKVIKNSQMKQKRVMDAVTSTTLKAGTTLVLQYAFKPKAKILLCIQKKQQKNKTVNESLIQEYIVLFASFTLCEMWNMHYRTVVSSYQDHG